MPSCYNLIACSPSYPSILGITDTILSTHVDELVSINGDNTKKYYVRNTRQLIARTVDNVEKFCSPGSILPVQYEIASIIYNGVEQIVTPQTYTVTSGNLQPLDCNDSSCSVVACSSANVYGNLSTFLNTVFTLYDIPLIATTFRSPSGVVSGYGCVNINATLGDTFDIQVRRTTGPLSPMTYHYGINNLGQAVFTVAGADSSYKLVSTEQCGGSSLGITSVTLEDICNDTPGCGCPDGFTLSTDGLTCTKFESVPATQNPTTYTAGPGSFAPGFYGTEAGQFYEDITNKVWPIVATNGPCPIISGTCSILSDALAVPLVVTDLVPNQIWGGAGFSSSLFLRLRIAGIWTTIAPLPINEWIGFAYCVTLTESKTYFIAFAVDDVAKFYLDGTLMIDHSTVGWSFRTWKMIPLTLTAGTHIIDGRVLNSGGSATFAYEIYDATLAQLLAVANPGDLDPYIVFSTKDYIGQSWQTGEVSGYSCPDGYSLNTCDGLVCSRTITVESEPCCYLLTGCKTGAGIITDTDLLAYVGQVIKINEFEGCFVVTVSDIECYQPVSVTISQQFVDCDSCDPCYILTNCKDDTITLKVTNDLLTEIGSIVLVNGDCWTVTGPAPDCVGALPVVITQIYTTCYECLPKCYILTNCEDVTISVTTTTDLSQYNGQVVHLKDCGNTCWYVEETIDCQDCFSVIVTESFDDCESCLPPPPESPAIELHPRKVKPGYDTPGCPPEYTEKVNCNFAEAKYKEIMSKRYGITICCQEETLKWDIKKHLLDLKAIYDPNLCKSTINRCCPPSCVTSIIHVYQAVSCPAPTDVESSLSLDGECPAPEKVDSYISVRGKEI